jgi:DNA-directed RNA polymerase subunit RPC12/RpoP
MVQQTSSNICSVCGADFANADLLRERDDLHANRCSTCGSEFTTEALLSAHERLHDSSSSAEDSALLKQQGERKP